MRGRTEQFQNRDGITFRCEYVAMWTTQYKRSVLAGDVADRTGALLLARPEVEEVWLRADSVRVRFLLPDPRVSAHKVVKDMKLDVAGALLREFPWLHSRVSAVFTRRYFLVSVGNVRETDVEAFLDSVGKRNDAFRHTEGRGDVHE